MVFLKFTFFYISSLLFDLSFLSMDCSQDRPNFIKLHVVKGLLLYDTETVPQGDITVKKLLICHRKISDRLLVSKIPIVGPILKRGLT